MKNVVVTFEGAGLQEIVSADPVALGNIAKGETRTIILAFAPPASMDPTYISGKLKLRQNGPPNKAYPRHLPVDVGVVSPAFAHPGGKYLLSYPPTLEAEYFPQWGVLMLDRPGQEISGTEKNAIYLTLSPNPAAVPFEEYYDGDPGLDYLVEPPEPLTVGGRTAYRFAPSMTLAGEVTVIIDLGDAFLEVSDLGASFQADGEFEMVLEGLHF